MCKSAVASGDCGNNEGGLLTDTCSKDSDWKGHYLTRPRPCGVVIKIQFNYAYIYITVLTGLYRCMSSAFGDDSSQQPAIQCL